MAKNDITGDEIKSRPTSQAYRDNYDKIFKRVVKNGLYLFTTPTCGPCSILKKKLDIANPHNIKVIDASEPANREWAKGLDVNRVPHLVAYDEGDVVGQYEGIAEIENFLSGLDNGEGDSTVA